MGMRDPDLPREVIVQELERLAIEVARVDDEHVDRAVNAQVNFMADRLRLCNTPTQVDKFVELVEEAIKHIIDEDSPLYCIVCQELGWDRKRRFDLCRWAGLYDTSACEIDGPGVVNKKPSRGQLDDDDDLLSRLHSLHEFLDLSGAISRGKMLKPELMLALALMGGEPNMSLPSRLDLRFFPGAKDGVISTGIVQLDLANGFGGGDQELLILDDGRMFVDTLLMGLRGRVNIIKSGNAILVSPVGK